MANSMNPCSEIRLDGGVNMSLGYRLSMDNKQHISKLVARKLEEVQNSSGKLRNFFGVVNKIEKANMAICGGAVRDWWLAREPKDIDLVLACPERILQMLGCNFPHNRSQFNGYMFDVGGTKVDIWRLQDSWIFTQDPTLEKTWEALLNSFPFNIDCILVFGDGRVLERGFFDGMNRREIELVSPINKNPVTNIVQRAIRFREKYGFKIGPKLQNEIDNHSKKSGIDYSKLFENLKCKSEGSSN